MQPIRIFVAIVGLIFSLTAATALANPSTAGQNVNKELRTNGSKPQSERRFLQQVSKAKSRKAKQIRERKIRNRIDRAINKASKIHNLPPTLIRALIQVESGGGSRGIRVISSKNAVGLTQLLPSTAREMGVRNLYDIEQNIIGGSGYLKKQIEKFDSLFLGLVAYNWGPGNARGALLGKKRIPRSVRRYANKIMRAHYDA